jgi:hypothetical protein
VTEATPVEPSIAAAPGPGIATPETLTPTSATEFEVALPPPPAVQSTRRLLGVSFDLLTQSTAAMRRASFYIGAIVLGTVGPLALATIVLDVTSPQGLQDFGRIARGAAGVWYALLAFLAYAGLIVAAVESRTMAAAILGARYAGRPISVAAALARSRMAFWRAIAASIIVTVPVSIATNIVDSVVVRFSNGSTGASLVVALVIGILIGAPLAYLLTGIVLGDVGAIESARRSIGVFKARKLAAALVAGFESLAIVLVIIGLGAGLGLVLEVTDALGLGTHSGPLALALIAGGVVVAVFAFGTLIFTALAISIAPQVVMFVGLTHATIGLDHVRPGGDHDPAIRHQGRRPFHWVPIPMWFGIGFGLMGLLGMIATLSD